MTPRHLPLGVLALAVLAAASAHAGTAAFSGDTTGGATFLRPLETFDPGPVGAAPVNYATWAFTVDTAGAYDFLSQAVGGWDNFTLLYSPGFSAANPGTNGVVANDDLAGGPDSGFTWNLSAATPYVFVTTGFEGGVDFGAFQNSITGPGNVAMVPEPGTWALMAGGLLGLGAWRQRSRARA
jgi:hypothetical protein